MAEAVDERFVVDPDEMKAVEKVLPIRAGGLCIFLILIYSSVFVYTFIQMANSLAAQKIGITVFFISAVVFLCIWYLMARVITHDPIIVWLVKYWRNNICGHYLRCFLDGDKKHIRIVVLPRNRRPSANPPCSASNILVTAPLGGWFMKSGYTLIASVLTSTRGLSFLRVFTFSVKISHPWTILCFQLSDGSNRPIFNLEKTFSVLRLIQSHVLHIRDWQSFIMFALPSLQLANEQEKLLGLKDIEIRELNNSLDLAQSNFAGFLVQLVEILDRSKRFIKSVSALEIKVWALNRLISLLLSGGENEVVEKIWQGRLVEASNQLDAAKLAKAKKQ